MLRLPVVVFVQDSSDSDGDSGGGAPTFPYRTIGLRLLMHCLRPSVGPKSTTAAVLSSDGTSAVTDGTATASPTAAGSPTAVAPSPSSGYPVPTFDPVPYHAFVAAAARLESESNQPAVTSATAPVSSVLHVSSVLLSSRLVIDLWAAGDLDALYAARRVLSGRLGVGLGTDDDVSSGGNQVDSQHVLASVRAMQQALFPVGWKTVVPSAVVCTRLVALICSCVEPAVGGGSGGVDGGGAGGAVGSGGAGLTIQVLASDRSESFAFVDVVTRHPGVVRFLCSHCSSSDLRRLLAAVSGSGSSGSGASGANGGGSLQVFTPSCMRHLPLVASASSPGVGGMRKSPRDAKPSSGELLRDMGFITSGDGDGGDDDGDDVWDNDTAPDGALTQWSDRQLAVFWVVYAREVAAAVAVAVGSDWRRDVTAHLQPWLDVVEAAKTSKGSMDLAEVRAGARYLLE